MRPELSDEFRRWAGTVPLILRQDALWRLSAYRLARFASARAWAHTTLLIKDPRMWRVSRQLYGALGSICANLAEGHARRSAADHARFYEYGLSSTRESREWYLQAGPILGQAVTLASVEVLAEITALLAAYVRDQRRRARGA